VAALEQARAQLQQTRERLQGAQPPQVEALTEAAERTQALSQAAVRQEAEEETRAAALEDLGRRLEEASQALESLEEGHAVLGRLHRVASGRNELRITFQRFVLAALLDQVTEMATRRLRVMSHGRYELRRASDPESKHSAGGLELEVWDHYTGVARDVVTLSGGESFLAALSLALGMADVVQSYAGGVHMEAIFIDEGFGSLDAESMELALEALTRLEAGGRMVGIISHVAELRERIPAQLAITPGRAGSRASFR
jgi:exonuclease SbcC